MNRSESIANLAAALCKAQAEFPAIPRNKEVTVTGQKGSYKFSYAPFEDILRHTKEARVKNGLAFTQSATDKELHTVIIHSSGEFFTSSVPLVLQSGGPQAMGSAITYARRYGFCDAFGIQADDDDDGNAAEGNHVQTSQKAPSSLSAAAVKADAFNDLSEDEKVWITDLAEAVTTMVTNGDVKDAADEIDHSIPQIGEKRLEKATEYKVALWGKLDSKTRSALTKYRNSLKEAA